MRIISKFHDYYDSITNIGGHDNTIVYLRDTVTVELPRNSYPLHSKFKPSLDQIKKALDNKDLYSYQKYAVFFCGKLYIGLRTFILDNQYNQRKYILVHNIWNDIETFQRILNTQVYLNLYSYDTNFAKMQFNDLLKEMEKDHTPLHLEEKSPIVMIQGSDGYGNDIKTINPNLSQIGFASAIDPYLAFQQLEGFVDTHFTRTLNVDTVNDKDRFEMHGFDSKKSFRKPPSK